jgi:hypothetical protein
MPARTNKKKSPDKKVTHGAPRPARRSKEQAPAKGSAKEPTDDNICFAIMPYGDWNDTYYAKIYAPAIKKAGLTPRRADDAYRPSAITHDIWVLARKAKLIIADLSGKNPNVFYELGLAHALAKPAIMITDSEEDVPFDLRSLRVIFYNRRDPNWGEKLQRSIKTAIQEVLASPSDAVLPTFLLQESMNTMKRDLNRLKRSPQNKELLKLEHGPQQITNGATQVSRPRMSMEEAMAFVSRSLKKKAPPVFILNMLKDSGYDLNAASSILERATREAYQSAKNPELSAEANAKAY